VRELQGFHLKSLNYTDELFRSDKMIDRTLNRLPTPPALFTTPQPIQPLPPPPASVPVPVVASPPPSSWAGLVQKPSPPPTIVLPLQAKNIQGKASAPARVVPPKPAAWDPGARGLDPPIVVNQSVLDQVKKRKDGEKLCNNHYLRGPCAKGDSCVFEHKYKPSADEKAAIAFLARLNPCTNGQDCEAEDCIYGHHVGRALYLLFSSFNANGAITVPKCAKRPVSTSVLQVQGGRTPAKHEV
jgi:hypothetical protein